MYVIDAWTRTVFIASPIITRPPDQYKSKTHTYTTHTRASRTERPAHYVLLYDITVLCTRQTIVRMCSSRRNVSNASDPKYVDGQAPEVFFCFFTVFGSYHRGLPAGRTVIMLHRRSSGVYDIIFSCVHVCLCVCVCGKSIMIYCRTTYISQCD